MSSEHKCIFCGSSTADGVCAWCGFSQQPKAQFPGTLEYGSNIGAYVVGDVVDMDGESTSYQAFDTTTQTKVIVKEFLPVSMVGPRKGNTVAVQRGKEVLFKNLMMDFTDLYSSLSKIESKNLQKILGLFSSNGTVYVVMEHIKGDNLRQNMIKRGKPYTFKEARWLLQDLFRLLSLLEKNNIAHGGISDETVIITPDNNIVLTGFAIRDLRVKNEHIMYKLYDGFSAPEQYNLNRFSGFYTDIYSVAALLYHMVTGRSFSSESLQLRDLAKYMPKYAVETLKYATKPNPQDRIDNIEDFVLMLDNKASIVKSKPETKRNSKTEANTDLNKKLYVVIVALAVVLVIVGLLAFTSGGQDAPPSSSMQEESIEPIVTELKVPDFAGKTYREIMENEEYTKYLFFNVSEEFDSRPIGQVIRQQPQPNTVVNQGAIIYLTVSKGEEKVKVQIPYGLVGRPLAEVQTLLDAMDISYTTKDVPQTKQYSYGTVTGTDIPEGVMIDPKETYIIIYVADNTPVVEITD